MGYETDSIRNKNLALTTELGQVRAECQALRNEMAMMKQSMARVRSKSAAEIRKARQQRKTRVVVREVTVPGPVRIVEKTVEKRVRGPVRIVEKPIEKRVPGPIRTVEKTVEKIVRGPDRIVEKIIEKKVLGPVRIVEKLVPGPVRTVTVPDEEQKAEAVKWKRLHSKLKIQVEDLVRRLNVGN